MWTSITDLWSYKVCSVMLYSAKDKSGPKRIAECGRDLRPPIPAEGLGADVRWTYPLMIAKLRINIKGLRNAGCT